MDKKSKSEILGEALENNGIKASMSLTRKAVYEAMDAYAEQESNENSDELDASIRMISAIVNCDDVEELVDIRDTMRNVLRSNTN